MCSPPARIGCHRIAPLDDAAMRAVFRHVTACFATAGCEAHSQRGAYRDHIDSSFDSPIHAIAAHLEGNISDRSLRVHQASGKHSNMAEEQWHQRAPNPNNPVVFFGEQSCWAGRLLHARLSLYAEVDDCPRT